MHRGVHRRSDHLTAVRLRCVGDAFELGAHAGEARPGTRAVPLDRRSIAGCERTAAASVLLLPLNRGLLTSTATSRLHERSTPAPRPQQRQPALTETRTSGLASTVASCRVGGGDDVGPPRTDQGQRTPRPNAGLARHPDPVRLSDLTSLAHGGGSGHLAVVTRNGDSV
jgi:hypothetical protein